MFLQSRMNQVVLVGTIAVGAYAVAYSIHTFLLHVVAQVSQVFGL
jgi:hypothetical protein